MISGSCDGEIKVWDMVSKNSILNIPKVFSVFFKKKMDLVIQNFQNLCRLTMGQLMEFLLELTNLLFIPVAPTNASKFGK